MLPTKFQVNWRFGSGEEAQVDFGHLGFLIGPILAMFGSTGHPNASCRASSQLAFRFRRRSENILDF